MDDLSRAYAILGLPPGASASQIKKRYRALIRQWHPDRFAQDPRGQAEAAIRMREINDAFRCVAANVGAPGKEPESLKDHSRRLTRQEIEGMVAGIGNDGPVDWFFDLFGSAFKRRAPTYRWEIALWSSFGIGLVIGTVLELLRLTKEAATPWVMCGTGAVTFLVLLRKLPRE